MPGQKSNWWDINWFDYSEKNDKTGAITKMGGALGPLTQVAGLANNIFQGNRMFDMQKEAFDFSKDKFWTNMAMNTDSYNRALNRSTKNMAQSAFGPGGATWDQANALNSTYNTGQITDLNGQAQPDIVSIPDKYRNSANGYVNPNGVQPGTAPVPQTQGTPRGLPRPGGAPVKAPVQNSSKKKNILT